LQSSLSNFCFYSRHFPLGNYLALSVVWYFSWSSALALPESLLGYVSLCSGATTSLELDFKDIVSDFSAVGESTVLPSVEVLDFVWFFYYAFLCKANFHYFDNGMFCSY
jgi:hypothetical protein